MSLSETVDLAKLAEEMVACLKDDPHFAAELISGCLEGGNPTIIAIAIRAIMRAEGGEELTEPTLADFLAITKRFGFTVRADSDSWGIGPYLDHGEFEKRFSDPRFTIPTLEHEGYIAMLEVDVNASLIRGRFVNAYSFPDFFGQTVDGAKAAFREVIRREKERAEGSGYQIEPPQRKKLPCLLPKQFDEWFPALSKTPRSDIATVLGCMDSYIEVMRKFGFSDEISPGESRDMTISDYQTGLHFISTFIGSYAPMPTKIGWIIWRLSEELSIIAVGGHPQFLRPAVYSGTKTGSPKHRALRVECACTVASLMRRGLSRDHACKTVANLMNEMKISIKKNGGDISARTVLSFYDAIRQEAERQGDLIYDAQHIFSAANRFLTSRNLDIEDRDPTGKGANFPEMDGKSPIENLRERLDLLSPIV